MKRCSKCNTEMVEGYGLKPDIVSCEIFLTDIHKVFSGKIDKLRAAVCPNCGEVSIYIDPDKLSR